MFASVLVVLVSVFTTVYLHVRPGCSEDIVFESASPGRRWIASAMQRRCGDEAPFSTHVNLRSANRPVQYGFFSGKAEEGEIFALEREALALQLTLVWDSPSQLRIQCSNCAGVSRHDEQWGDIVVKYRLAEVRP